MTREVAVVSGGAHGIGLLVAKKLAGTHRVVLLDGPAERVQRAAAACGPEAISAVCEITRQDHVDAAVARVVEQVGAIDIVISPVGVDPDGSPSPVDPDILATTLEASLTCNWRIIHACLPHVTRRRGYVLGVVPAAETVPASAADPHWAGTAAFEMLLDVLRLEVGHLGVDIGIAYVLAHDPDATAAIVAAVQERRRTTFSPEWLRSAPATRVALHTKLALVSALKIAENPHELTAHPVATNGTFEAEALRNAGA